MLGVVAGYSKQHTIFGSPELKQDPPKRRYKKIIRPKKRHEAIQYIETFNKTI